MQEVFKDTMNNLKDEVKDLKRRLKNCTEANLRLSESGKNLVDFRVKQAIKETQKKIIDLLLKNGQVRAVALLKKVR